MNPQALAQEIIDGRRLTRQDDLKAFLTCDLQALCEGADKIRKHFVGERVDLCSIINGRSGAVRKTANSVRSLHITIPIARFTASFRRRIS